MKRSLSFLAAWAMFATGCSSSDEATEPGTDEQDVIIGANNLVAVSAAGDNVPSRYRPILNAFGRLRVSGGLCTATHVGNGVVVSAGHCFDAPASEVRNRACNGTSVEWGYRGGSVVSRSTCQTILAMANGPTTDYAIFRVSPVPPTAVAVNVGARPAPGSRLTIFSHPQGRPLRWSQTCPLQGRVSGNEFGHTCDTQGGSSGATILDDSTLRVAGIHWGGGGSRNIGMYVDASPLAATLKGAGALLIGDDERPLEGGE